VRVVAVFELRGRPEATEALLEALADQSPQVRREAVKALEDAPPDATVRRALIEVIAQDLSPAVRQEAVRVLAAFLGSAGDAGAA
ncbi:MAG: sister chromatid cohesion protein PDS5, partial [Actinomycetota bacterium]|nr:sister chromatid cohesion protein PDS5 [Actinomycetota bacterium]